MIFSLLIAAAFAQDSDIAIGAKVVGSVANVGVLAPPVEQWARAGTIVMATAGTPVTRFNLPENLFHVGIGASVDPRSLTDVPTLVSELGWRQATPLTQHINWISGMDLRVEVNGPSRATVIPNGGIQIFGNKDGGAFSTNFGLQLGVENISGTRVRGTPNTNPPYFTNGFETGLGYTHNF